MKKYAKKVAKQADDIDSKETKYYSPEKYDDADLAEEDHHAIKVFSPSKSKRNYFG